MIPLTTTKIEEKENVNKSSKPEGRKTLFEIQAGLEDIFDTLEENGGELTPELEEALAVHENDLKDKLSGYVYAVRKMKSEIEACKTEKKRIDDIKKRNEKNVSYMNGAIKDAVIRFGSSNKSGSKFIDLGLNKITVRKSNASKLDEDSIEAIIASASEYLAKLQEEDKIEEAYGDPESLVRNLLKFINDELSEPSLDGSRSINVTADDLCKIKCSVTIEDTLIGLLLDYEDLMMDVAAGNAEIKNETSIAYAKEIIEKGEDFRFLSPSEEYNVLIK